MLKHNITKDMHFITTINFSLQTVTMKSVLDPSVEPLAGQADQWESKRRRLSPV